MAHGLARRVAASDGPRAASHSAEADFARAVFVIVLLSGMSTSVADVARAAQSINWEPQSVWSTVTTHLGGQKVLISPGGTVYVVWSALNGISPGNPDNSGSGRDTLCDSRLEFASNDTVEGCPDFLSETNLDSPPPVHARCPYYYLPDILSSVYVRARYPDGTWAAQIETVSVVTTVVGSETLLTDNRGADAAVGPDGALHVVWTQRVPNLAVEAAAYHDRGLFFNRCGEDVDFDQDLDSLDVIEWCVAAADSNDSCCAEPIDSLHIDTSPCTAPNYPCWRHLAPLHRICYRRRSPSGQWGPIYTNITPRSDPLEPLEARQALIPVITVDRDGMVHVAWGQKHEQFPSCAFWVNNRGFKAGIPFIGIPNVAMFDAFYRSWDGGTGPTPNDLVYPITEEPPELLPPGVDSLTSGYFQSDWPVDILVTGSGSQKRIHVALNYGAQFPTGGAAGGADPPHGYLDAEVYTMSANGGLDWTPRKHLTTHPREALPDSFPDNCMANSIGFQVNAPWSYVRLVEGEDENVHAFYTHTDFYFIGGSGCSPGNCPLPTSCFYWLGSEQFHRSLGHGDSTEWWPPDSLPANRLSDYGGPGERCRGDNEGVGVYDVTGTLHAFWRDAIASDGGFCHFAPDTLYDSVRIYHASTLNGVYWSARDTVAAFWTGTHNGGDFRNITGLDVAELNGIFHVVVGYAAPGVNEMRYFRGVLGPEIPGTLPCDSTTTYNCDHGAKCWSGTLSLCHDYVVAQCETLRIAPGTMVNIVNGAIEIRVRGKLIAEGTETQPITFRPNPYVVGPERARAGFWMGIRLVGGSARASLKHVSISGAVYGIRDEPGTVAQQTPYACASQDTTLRPGTLWIENCRFAYNTGAGVYVKGDGNLNTSDRVHITNSEILTSLKGIIMENAAAPDCTGGRWVIAQNKVLYNDRAGIELRGSFNRKVVVRDNLVQGLGADELILSLPDSNFVDSGFLYDGNYGGAGSDSVFLYGNTFFRVEGAGVDLNFPEEKFPGVQSSIVVGKDIGQGGTPMGAGNLFLRDGVCLSSRYTERVHALGNDFLYYGTGVLTNDRGPRLGAADDSTLDVRNFFYNRPGENLLQDWSEFANHVVIEPDGMPDTVDAHWAYWNPITGSGQTCAASTYFSFESGDLIRLAPCADTTLLPSPFPRMDSWGAMNLPLKRLALAPGTSGEPQHFEWRLDPTVPNPTRGPTTFRFALPSGGETWDLSVYDVQGRRVRSFSGSSTSAGELEINWDGRDEARTRVASGIYFFRLRGRGFDATRRMVLLR